MSFFVVSFLPDLADFDFLIQTAAFFETNETSRINSTVEIAATMIQYRVGLCAAKMGDGAASDFINHLCLILAAAIRNSMSEACEAECRVPFLPATSVQRVYDLLQSGTDFIFRKIAYGNGILF